MFSSADTVITNKSVDVDIGEPYIYEPLELRLCGPALPSGPEMPSFARGLEPAPHPALIGGGFHAEIAVARALTDAFSGLFMFDLAGDDYGGGGGGGGGDGGGGGKRRKTHDAAAKTIVHDPLNLNDSSVMETSMVAHQTGGGGGADVSLMDVSLMNSSRMSLS